MFVLCICQPDSFHGLQGHTQVCGLTTRTLKLRANHQLASTDTSVQHLVMQDFGHFFHNVEELVGELLERRGFAARVQLIPGCPIGTTIGHQDRKTFRKSTHEALGSA